MNYRELRFTFTSIEEALNKVEKFLKGGGVGDKGEILLILTKGDLEAIASRAKRYIDENYRGLKSIAPVADHFGLSVQTLIRHFKDSFGITPGQYLRNLRRTYARSLRKDGYLLKEIAERLGYKSEKYVSRLIKKEEKS